MTNSASPVCAHCGAVFKRRRKTAIYCSSTCREEVNTFPAARNRSLRSKQAKNGDGKADLLRRDASGNTAIRFMDATMIASTGVVGNIPTSWTVQTVIAE
jgi:hypothetical protein